MQVREIHRKKFNTKPKAEIEELIKKKKKEDSKMAKGKFEFVDAQGGYLEFTHRLYPGDPVQVIRIDHDEIVEIPMGVVRQLHNAKKKVRRVNTQVVQHGPKVPMTEEYISRVKFTPVEYL